VIKAIKTYLRYRKIRRLFIKFLKDNDIYYAFQLELDADLEYFDFNSYVKEKISSGLGYGLISSAFSWDLSPQGHTFWDKLNDKWQDIIIGVNK